MRRTSTVLTLVFACTVSATSASDDLLRAALNPNPALKAYTAAAQLDVTLHAAIPLRKKFTGTMYYNRPTQRLVLDDAKGALSKYKDLRMTLPSDDAVFRNYTLTSTNNDGSTTRFALAPKAEDSRVQLVTVSVDDQTHLIHGVQWRYTNKSSLVITPAFTKINGYNVAPHEDIAARFPGYSVDATLNISNYTFTP